MGSETASWVLAVPEISATASLAPITSQREIELGVTEYSATREPEHYFNRSRGQGEAPRILG